jgi:hypothetical protein
MHSPLDVSFGMTSCELAAAVVTGARTVRCSDDRLAQLSANNDNNNGVRTS